MKRENYEKMAMQVRKRPILMNGIIYSDKILTKLSYVIYPIFFIYLLIKDESDIYAYIIVPAVSFAVISIFRYVLCAPRPYELFNIPPVIKKDTKGKSFPSRHVFSAFVIATSVFHFSRPEGIVLGAFGIILAASRVFGGVHFIRDVIAGGLLGIIMAVAGFYLATGSF